MSVSTMDHVDIVGVVDLCFDFTPRLIIRGRLRRVVVTKKLGKPIISIEIHGCGRCKTLGFWRGPNTACTLKKRVLNYEEAEE